MPELLKWSIWILAAVGGVTLVGLLIIGGFILKKIHRAKKYINQFMEPEGIPAARVLEKIPAPACHWKGIAEPEWNSPELMERHHEELKSLHFERLGFFSHSESDEYRALYLLASQGAVAWLTENYEENGLVEISVVSWLEPGIPVTVTTASDSGFEILLPGEIRQFRPGYSAFQLCEELIKARSGGNLMEVSPENIIPRLEQAEERRAFQFAADQKKQDEWRRFVSSSETADESDESDEDGTSLNLDTAFQASYESALHDCLSTCCLMSFARNTGLTADQWLKVGDRLLVVHDRVSSAVMGYVDVEDELSEESFEDLAHGDTSFREAFEAMNRQNPPNARWKRIGEVSEPIEAEVYLAS